MRLTRFRLAGFRNLREIDVSFGRSPLIGYGAADVQFFVGLNGSGKSNALEALGMIFSHVAAGADPGFRYLVEYELGGRVVRIDGIDGRRAPIGATISVREPGGPWEEVPWSSTAGDHLPQRIVGFSTGPTSGLAWALFRSIEDLAREDVELEDFQDEEEWADVLRAQREAFLDESQTLFFDAGDALLPALPLFVHHGGDGDRDRLAAQRRRLAQQVGLDPELPVLAFSLRIAGGWEDRLRGRARERLRGLLAAADARTLVDLAGPLGEDPPPQEFVAAFDVAGADELQRLLCRQFPSPLRLLEELVRWRRHGALLGIDLVVRKQGVDQPFLARRLSDGEFFLLGRYALLHQLSEESSTLILLDEPETYFNDRWKVDLVRDVAAALGGDGGSGTHQVVLATHASITLSDADPRAITLFANGRDGDEAGIRAVSVNASTFGAAQSEIARILFDVSPAVGSFADERIAGAVRHWDQPRLEALLALIGGGFHRFAVRDRVHELRDGPGRPDADRA